MARNWRDYRTATDGRDNRDNSDVREGSERETRPIVPNVTIVTGAAPDILAGLDRLKNAPAPRLKHPEQWPIAVADAAGIVSDGWASQALSLGWTVLDLFGAVTDPAGDPFADGLAVKLSGRKVLAICASFATVADTNNGRSFLYRGSNAGAVLLWALGRGR